MAINWRVAAVTALWVSSFAAAAPPTNSQKSTKKKTSAEATASFISDYLFGLREIYEGWSAAQAFTASTPAKTIPEMQTILTNQMYGTKRLSAGFSAALKALRPHVQIKSSPSISEAAKLNSDNYSGMIQAYTGGIKTLREVISTTDHPDGQLDSGKLADTLTDMKVRTDAGWQNINNGSLLAATTLLDLSGPRDAHVMRLTITKIQRNELIDTVRFRWGTDLEKERKEMPAAMLATSNIYEVLISTRYKASDEN